jgi:glycosyltransferase involved in cell wall biosynthesis
MVASERRDDDAHVSAGGDLALERSVPRPAIAVIREVAARRVLFVTFHFPPDARVGALRCQKFVKYLPEFGWSPEVLTVREECHPAVDPSRLADVARAQVWRTGLMPNPLDVALHVRAVWRRWLKLAAPDNEAGGGGRSAVADPTYVRPVGWFRRSVFSLLQLPDRHVGWLPFGVLRGWELCRSRRIAAIVTSGPPQTCHLIGLLLHRLTGVAWIVDFRDPWVGNAYKPDFARTALSDRLDRAMEAAVVRRAARVVSISARHRSQLVKAYPAEPPAKFVTIPNGFDPADFPVSAPADRDDGVFTVAHVGTIYGRRSADACLAALARAIQEGAIPAAGVRMRFVGSINEDERLRALVARYGLGAVVEFTGAVPYPQALRLMRQADLLLLLAQEQPEQIPLKTFEYLGVGAPILAIAGEGATADLVREAGGLVSGDDPEEIKAALLECYLGHRSRDAGDRSTSRQARTDVSAFERRNLARRLASTLDEVSAR